MAKTKPPTAREAAAPPEPAEPARAAARPEPPPLHPLFARWQTTVIPRERINKAPYNPRQIDTSGQSRLKKSMREFGMVENLIWNQRTGNLVGGHQRLTILDQQAGREEGYGVEVKVVDLDETKEKELNVVLNNPEAQGFFDWNKLAKDVLVDPQIDVDLLGFDTARLKSILDSQVSDLGGIDLAHIFPKKDDPAAADADAVRAMKAAKEEYKDVSGEAAKDGFYVGLVFKTPDEKEKFCAFFNLSPNSKWVQGRALVADLMRRGIAIDIGWAPPPDPGQDGVSEPPPEPGEATVLAREAERPRAPAGGGEAHF
jgi:hypothetical protein